MVLAQPMQPHRLATRRGPLLLLFLGIFSYWTHGAGAAASPQGIIEETSNRLLAALKSDRERFIREPERLYRLVDEVLVPHVDFEHTSRLALGRHWHNATPQQRERFKAEFKKMLVRTYASAFIQASKWSVEFLPQRNTPGADDILVRTQLMRSGAPPVEVSYRMRLKDGDWKAYDVSVEGVSLVTTYRSTFNQEIRNLGMDGLIELLADRNAIAAAPASEPRSPGRAMP